MSAPSPESELDLLLIAPPVGNIGQAPASCSVLTAYLRACGWRVSQWDLGIEAFHHFHAVPELDRCRRALGTAGAEAELCEVAARVVTDIDDAKRALREPDIAACADRMRWAFNTLRDAGVVLTAAAGGRYQLDFRRFAIPNALVSFEWLSAALDDERSNPFVAYYREQVIERLLARAPRAVGLSVSYDSQLLPALTLARLLRVAAPDLLLVWGGSYLTAVAEQATEIPRAVAAVDAIVVHDGEEALDHWLGQVFAARPIGEGLSNLLVADGASYRPCGAGPPRQTDLSTLPVPMWTAAGLELDRYLVPSYPIGLPLSRGCYWGRCSYCNISSHTAGSYRSRPVDQAVADICAAKDETGSHWFDLPVDSFRPRDLAAIARGIVDAGLDIEWAAEVLLDPGFTAERLALLATSGCRFLRFGLESACRDTLKAMHKSARPAVARRILADCQREGIRTGVMLIAGYPSEQQAGLGQTFDFLVACRQHIDFVTVHAFSLVPGSPMARDPGAFALYLRPGRGVLAPNLPFANTNPGGMQSEHLPRAIEQLRDALREHYPDIGELWTAAIGGWMTFPACCVPRPTDPAARCAAITST